MGKARRRPQRATQNDGDGATPIALSAATSSALSGLSCLPFVFIIALGYWMSRGPPELDLKLATAAIDAGDHATAESTLRAAIELSPIWK